MGVHDLNFGSRLGRGVGALLLAAGLMLLSACLGAGDGKAKQKRAIAMWQERCKTSGEFIHKTADAVGGIFLLTLRPPLNYGDQFRLDDPYGDDMTGDDFLRNFLRGFYQQPESMWPADYPPRFGYSFIEARDTKDGQLYRYTGRFEEPWQTNKSYLKGYIRFALDKAPIAAVSVRYGVRFDDISTREEREHWIAGSSLKVIDLQTQEVMAERIGYMVDAAQGSRAGQRSPWLFAADNACPDFQSKYPRPLPGGGSQAQSGQTLDFVQKALKPARGAPPKLPSPEQ